MRPTSLVAFLQVCLSACAVGAPRGVAPASCPGERVAADTAVHDTLDVDTWPYVLHDFGPSSLAQYRDGEGQAYRSVKVQFIVGSDGLVEPNSLRALDLDDWNFGFGESALAAIQQTLWCPATWNGERVRSRVRQPVVVRRL